MNGAGYQKLRTGIQQNASPGTERDLTAMEMNLRELLMATGLFEEVEIEHTDDLDQLVVGLCKFAPGYSEADVAAAIEHLWQDRARYPFWETHQLRVSDDFVEFEAATRQSETGHYVTVHVIAQPARMPAQRVSAE